MPDENYIPQEIGLIRSLLVLLSEYRQSHCSVNIHGKACGPQAAIQARRLSCRKICQTRKETTGIRHRPPLLSSRHDASAAIRGGAVSNTNFENTVGETLDLARGRVLGG